MDLPKQFTELRILVAYPSDVERFVPTVHAVVAEVNAIISETASVQFRAIDWQKDTRPELGSDPQDIVNRQLGEFDVFIGLLWTRIGTETPRAQSGFVEEFQRALKKKEQGPHSIEVMVYFCNGAIAPSEIDSDQWRRVQEFRSEIEKKGLYREFTDESSLRSNLQRALHSIAVSWGEHVSDHADAVQKPVSISAGD